MVIKSLSCFLVPEPLLKHRQDPRHLAVVAWVSGQIFAHQFLNEIGTNDTSCRERTERILDELPQGRRACRPEAKGQSEAFFLLGNDCVGQEASQRFLEEPA